MYVYSLYICIKTYIKCKICIYVSLFFFSPVIQKIDYKFILICLYMCVKYFFLKLRLSRTLTRAL